MDWADCACPQELKSSRINRYKTNILGKYLKKKKSAMGMRKDSAEEETFEWRLEMSRG